MLGSKLFLMWRGTARPSRRRGALLLLGWRCSEPRCHSFLKHRFFLGLARSLLSPTATFWSLNLPIANRGHCGQLNITQAVGGGTHPAELGLLWPVTPKRWKEKKKLPIYLSRSQPQVVVVIWEEYSGKVAFLFTFIVFVKPLKISRNPC